MGQGPKKAIIGILLGPKTPVFGYLDPLDSSHVRQPQPGGELLPLDLPKHPQLSFLDLQNAQNNGPISQNGEYRQYSPKIMDPTMPILAYCGILAHCFGHFGNLGLGGDRGVSNMQKPPVLSCPFVQSLESP